MMIIATASMLFSCKSHKPIVQAVETEQHNAVLSEIQQHIQQQEQKDISIEWQLNYTLLSEPDSAGRQHATQTGTIVAAVKDNGIVSKSKDNASKTAATSRCKEKAVEREKGDNTVSITPIMLCALAVVLIASAIAIRWLVRKRAKQVPST